MKGPEVLEGIEKVFHDQVKPAWFSWQKDVRRGGHNIRLDQKQREILDIDSGSKPL